MLVEKLAINIIYFRTQVIIAANKLALELEFQ